MSVSLSALIRVIRGESASAEQLAEVHEVGDEAALHALADHTDGVVRVQRLKVRTRDAEVRDALVGVEFQVEQPGRVLDELEVGAVELGEGLLVRALQTETQVMVKREDEQAFAELNGAYLKFVEDAARLLYKEFDADRRIADFRIACSHLESLHSHDAVSVICKGVQGGFTADFMDFGSLLC